MVVVEIESNIETKLEDGKGYILLGETLSNQDTRHFRRAYENLERKNIKEIYVNMAKVNQIDSSGVGILVVCLKRAREKGGDFKIMFPRDEVKRIFKLVNIYSYFEIIE